MPISLAKRFEGQEGEIVDYVKAWGKYKAMDRYGVADVLAFNKFLDAQGCDEKIGLNPTFIRSDVHSVGEQLVDAFADKLLKVTELNQKLTAENEELRHQIELLKVRERVSLEPKLQRLAALCER